MGQVTLYLDGESEAKMRAAAHAKLAGTWSDEDFPSVEEIRSELGEDVPRESF